MAKSNLTFTFLSEQVAHPIGELRSLRGVVIYALTESDGEVRYVGKSACMFGRYHQHISLQHSKSEYCRRWIRKLRGDGEVPSLVILEKVDPESTWPERERWWIAHFRSKMARLVNLSDGGEGISGFKHTDETKRRMSAYAKSIGRRPPFDREAVSAALKGRKPSAATIAGIIKYRTGRPLSEFHRKRCAEGTRKRWEDPNQRRLASEKSAKLTPWEVGQIYNAAVAGEVPQWKIADKFGVSESSVSMIRNLHHFEFLLGNKEPGTGIVLGDPQEMRAKVLRRRAADLFRAGLDVVAISKELNRSVDWIQRMIRGNSASNGLRQVTT